jgi:DNA replication protein DnaC
MKELRDLLRRAREMPVVDSSRATVEEVRPDCPVCRGTGFVVRKYPLDDPRFGKAEPCGCILAEATDTRRERLERISNIGSLTRFTFDTLRPTGRDGASLRQREAYEAAMDFAAEPKGFFVITGPSGSGKTHVAAAMANRRIEMGQPALFWVVPDLLDELRSSYKPEEDELAYDQLFEQVRNAPLLFLDGIDAASPTPWAKEKLFQVINHRFNLELPTVFTCAQRPEQLEDRLATRLADARLSRVVELSGAVATGTYAQVGGMTRNRLAEMQFGDLVESSGWSATERASFRAAVTTARDYAEEPEGWLVILGANGCGKTHLAAAVANKAVARGASVFFAVVPDLLDHLRKTFHPNADQLYDELFDQVRNAALLVLDDMGAHSSTPWAEEKLYQVVNYRTLSHLPTIVTTDLKPEGVQQVHPRIYSRIFDPHQGRIVELLAPHYALGRSPTRQPAPRRPGR